MDNTPLSDDQFRHLVYDHLEGVVSPEGDACLAGDPARWRSALIRLVGLVNAQIATINPVVKRINAAANERARVDAMRRRALETVPEEPKPAEKKVVEVVYVRRGVRS